MDFTKLSEELCQLHIAYAGVINQMVEGTSAKGEDGLLLWLNGRRQETFSTDIARHFGLSPGRVANILKKVEQKNLIRREQDMDDLRKICVILTEEGKTYADQCYAKMVGQHKLVLEMLGYQEAEQLIELIRRILHMTDETSQVSQS